MQCLNEGRKPFGAWNISRDKKARSYTIGCFGGKAKQVRIKLSVVCRSDMAG